MKNNKSFWVIETGRNTYWDGRQVKDDAHFVTNIDDAIKFYDFQSAEIVRCWLLEKGEQRLRSVEHAYMTTPTTTNQKEGQ